MSLVNLSFGREELAPERRLCKIYKTLENSKNKNLSRNMCMTLNGQLLQIHDEHPHVLPEPVHLLNGDDF